MGREAFLGHIRTATTVGALPSAPVADPGLLVPDLGEADLPELFVLNLSAVDGNVRRTSADGAVDEVLAAVADDSGAYLAWDDGEIGVPGLSAALAQRGLDRLQAVVPTDAKARLAHHDTYLEVGIGITGADAGLAESGSLVLVSGAHRPRMASLIPHHHVAVLRASRIVRSLPHLMAARREMFDRGSNFVVITGPSRTADIEMTLTLGVHGPRHLTVVLIED